jgi:hypothetical protein
VGVQTSDFAGIAVASFAFAVTFRAVLMDGRERLWRCEGGMGVLMYKEDKEGEEKEEEEDEAGKVEFLLKIEYCPAREGATNLNKDLGMG